MNTSLLATAGVMGLVGGPHCLAMCGAACVGVSHWSPHRVLSPLLLFQLGRLIGYALLGAVVAGSMQALGWMTVHSTALRPVWSMVHIAALVIGLMLMIRAEQPVWLSNAASGVWHKLSSPRQRQSLHQHPLGPLLLGLVWAFLPCGLLYSALLVAMLSASPLEGAAVMSSFAVGGALMLICAPWLWGRLARWQMSSEKLSHVGVRLAGLGLAASSAWGLWMGLVEQQAPWCVGIY
jgi:sulfite exporter TauE/SafE